ncbi:MAG: ABC transporter ATP-binding protein/permease [Clostridiales bacterium]|nr:ABC transporter ATP-binding protein/permease [Clostridiales bacterium]
MLIINLIKTYKLKGETVNALKGVSFDLPDTGMVFILGKSGCGKSTLLNVLSGLDNFDSGDVIFKGKSLKGFTVAELNSYRNSCCGFVFQEYNLIHELNVHDNIALALELQGEKDVTDKVDNALKQVGLAGYAGRKVNELSGGQKQRVAVARCIVKDPQIIFADEPSGALDSDTGALLFALLKKLSKDRLVIVVSHDKEAAFTYGDRIIELSDGKVVGDTNGDFKTAEGKDTYTARTSKLGLKSALKLSCSNYKFHPIRLIATVLLAVFSFTFFGLSLVFATFSKVTPFVNMVYSSDAQYLTLNKYETGTHYDSNILEKLLGYQSYSRKSVAYANEDLQRLQSKISQDLMLVIQHYTWISGRDETAAKYPLSDDLMQKIDSAEEHITSNVSGYMSITQKTIDEHGFELIGRLPESNDEVVITECNYNYFKLLGYKDEEGNIYEINTPDDIIEHRLWKYEGFTITGVLKTGCDNACYNNNHPLIERRYAGQILNITPEYYPEYFSLESDMLFHERFYVTADYIMEHTDDYFSYNENNVLLICPVPKAKKDLRKFVRFVSSYNNQGYNKAGVFYQFEPWSTLLTEYADYINDDNDPSIALHPTELNQKVDWYNEAILSAHPLSMLCLYLGGIFFIFTFVLLLNFIATSIRSQTKQVGIISALGADFRAIYKVYGLSSVIVCGAIFLLSLIPIGIGANAFNAPQIAELLNWGQMSFKLLYLNIWTILGMFAIAMVTALLGTLIALRKYRKLSPADIIRKGQIK